MEKGEIARYEQFLLFPQCFQKACFPGASKGVIAWEWVKVYHYCIDLALTKYCRVLTKRQILDSSRLKDFADDIFKFDEKRRNFTLPVENTVRKEKLLVTFPTEFLKGLNCRHAKTKACFGKGSSLIKRVSENRTGKKANPGNQQLLLFPQSCH